MIADQELDKRLLMLKTVWFAMLISLVIYLFLGFYVGSNLGPLKREDAFGKMRVLLYMVSFIILIATWYMRKVLLSRKRRYHLSHLSSQEFQHLALQVYTIVTIVALAMSEGIGICGLVLFFLGKNPIDLYLLILISAGALFMYRPRREEVVTLARESQEDTTTGGTTSSPPDSR